MKAENTIRGYNRGKAVIIWLAWSLLSYSCPRPLLVMTTLQHQRNSNVRETMRAVRTVEKIQ